MKRSGLRKDLIRYAAAAAACILLVLCVLNREKLGELLEAVNGAPGTVQEDSPPLHSVPDPVDQEAVDGLEVYFFDVGQGDSQLIRYRQEETVFTMLIDTGEYPCADGLTDTLRSLGVETLDVFIISHPHTDHMGCAARIVQRFGIGRVFMPRVQDELVPTTAAFEALLNALEDKGITAETLDQAAVFDMLPPDLSLQALAPRTDAAWEGLNNWSAVLRLSFGETSFLFPGDAERDALDVVREDAAASGWELNSTVLKCGHHGSNDANPSKWLKAVSPRYAVISCGAGNDYGHPHREPLERLEKLGAQIYRTDENGTILARSDGKNVVMESGLPSVKTKK